MAPPTGLVTPITVLQSPMETVEHKLAGMDLNGLNVWISLAYVIVLAYFIRRFYIILKNQVSTWLVSPTKAQAETQPGITYVAKQLEFLKAFCNPSP